ncbi:MAG: GAP family protein [Roseiflexaceae bacterium]|nr:GAP family protein [Roseiflexaceae bacterium]
MFSVIGQVLPEAVVIAFSPFPIVGIILILFTKEARTNSLLFTLGWLLGLTIVAAIVLALANAGNSSVGQDTVDTGIKWVSLLFGLGLLFLAYRYWQKRPKAGEPAATPKWMATLDSIKPGGALGLGALLSAVNPKSLLLTVSAILTIAGAHMDAAATIIVTVVFILLASITIVGIMIYVLIAGASAEKTLNQAKEWLLQNNSVMMAGILLVIGAKQVGQGFSVF